MFLGEVQGVETLLTRSPNVCEYPRRHVSMCLYKCVFGWWSHTILTDSECAPVLSVHGALGCRRVSHARLRCRCDGSGRRCLAARGPPETQDTDIDTYCKCLAKYTHTNTTVVNGGNFLGLSVFQKIKFTAKIMIFFIENFIFLIPLRI